MGVSAQKKQQVWLWLIRFYVPCPERTWTFRALYNFLSFGVMLIFLLSLSLPSSAICVCVTYFYRKKNNFQLLAMKAVFITAVGKTKRKENSYMNEMIK